MSWSGNVYVSNRLGNMSISMLWLGLVSSQGTDGRTNDDQGKDVVPEQMHNISRFSTFLA